MDIKTEMRLQSPIGLRSQNIERGLYFVLPARDWYAIDMNSTAVSLVLGCWGIVSKVSIYRYIVLVRDFPPPSPLAAPCFTVLTLNARSSHVLITKYRYIVSTTSYVVFLDISVSYQNRSLSVSHQNRFSFDIRYPISQHLLSPPSEVEIREIKKKKKTKTKNQIPDNYCCVVFDIESNVSHLLL